VRTRGEGILQMWTSGLFGATTSDFSKFLVCPYRQGGEVVEPERTRGSGSTFLRFCADVLYERPLFCVLYFAFACIDFFDCTSFGFSRLMALVTFILHRRLPHTYKHTELILITQCLPCNHTDNVNKNTFAF